MKIPKKDALTWFTFFSELPEEEELGARQQELVYAVFAQIEDAVRARHKALKAAIPGLQTLAGRTFYVGSEG